MSEVLMEFAEPCLRLADESYHRAFLSMAVTSWNGSLLPAEKRNQVKFPDVDGASWFSELFGAMVARKHEAFAENNWMVQEYEIVGTGAEARIKVTTTVLMPPCLPNKNMTASRTTIYLKSGSSAKPLSTCYFAVREYERLMKDYAQYLQCGEPKLGTYVEDVSSNDEHAVLIEFAAIAEIRIKQSGYKE